MAETLFERLNRLLPGGKGVWIPMDHGISGYPERGLERMDEVVDSCIEAGADAKFILYLLFITLNKKISYFII